MGLVIKTQKDATRAFTPVANPLTGSRSETVPETAVPVQAPKPDDAAALAALRALIGSGTVDESQVRRIVAEALADQPVRKIEVTQAGQTTATMEGLHHEKFPLLIKLISLQAGHILMVGPPGSGKTVAAEKACELLKRDFFCQPPIGDKFEVTGFRDAQGQYQDTPVYRWCKAAPGAVLMLDEVDGGFAQALLALNVCLANGIAVFPHEQLQIPREHIVISNGNTWGGGADADFTGRSKLDAAFLDRFPNKILWDYDLKFEQALCGPDAKHWCLGIQKMRQNARDNGIKVIITPRSTMAYCNKRRAGWSHQEAFDTGFPAMLKPDVLQKLMNGVHFE